MKKALKFLKRVIESITYRKKKILMTDLKVGERFILINRKGVDLDSTFVRVLSSGFGLEYVMEKDFVREKDLSKLTSKVNIWSVPMIQGFHIWKITPLLSRFRRENPKI